MSDLTSFRSIIELWGKSRDAMAADLPGVTANQVSKWWQRDSIPADCWAPILSTEKAITAGLKAETLAALAARQPADEEVRA